MLKEKVAPLQAEKIKLTFSSGLGVELVRVDCSTENGASLTSIRGKTAGAYQGVGTFQWSSAVRAVACLFLKAQINDDSLRIEPMLSGEAKSLAASLDYALSKQPAWLLDMFGVSSGGKARAKRLFSVTNPNRKRSGPVEISLNARVCPKGSITIILDGKVVDSKEELDLMLKTIVGGESVVWVSPQDPYPDSDLCDADAPLAA